MSGGNSFKFVPLPPQSDTTRDWAKRLAKIVSEARVLVIGGGVSALKVRKRLVRQKLRKNPPVLSTNTATDLIQISDGSVRAHACALRRMVWPWRPRLGWKRQAN